MHTNQKSDRQVQKRVYNKQATMQASDSLTTALSKQVHTWHEMQNIKIHITAYIYSTLNSYYQSHTVEKLMMNNQASDSLNNAYKMILKLQV